MSVRYCIRLTLRRDVGSDSHRRWKVPAVGKSRDLGRSGRPGGESPPGIGLAHDRRLPGGSEAYRQGADDRESGADPPGSQSSMSAATARPETAWKAPDAAGRSVRIGELPAFI